MLFWNGNRGYTTKPTIVLQPNHPKSECTTISKKNDDLKTTLSVTQDVPKTEKVSNSGENYQRAKIGDFENPNSKLA